MVKVLFLVRKAQSKSNRHYLYCRVTVNNEEREFSTEEVISDPSAWNQEQQVYEKEDQEGGYINTVCNKLKFSIKSLYLTSDNSDKLTPIKIIEKLKPGSEKTFSVAALVQDYINYEKRPKKKKNEKQLAPETIAHHEKYLANLKEYKPKLQVQAFDLDEAEKFKEWFMTEKDSGVTRPSRHIEYFRKALDYAIKKKKIKEHSLVHYSFDRDPEKEPVWLEDAEINLWLNAEFENPDLQKARDLFIYEMGTGVAYGDIWNKLTVREIEGVGKIMIGRRNKGKKPFFFVPCDPMAEAVVNKYNGELPKMDNSDYNKLLKIIAEILGIKKVSPIVPHTARKTFSMRMLANGWSKETIQMMLGHKSIRTTENYYMGVSPERLINEMKIRSSASAPKWNYAVIPSQALVLDLESRIAI